MLIINQNDIHQLTNPVALTDDMITCMKVYASKKYIMPDRMHMDIQGNTLLLMPAASGSFFSTKLVSLFQKNPEKGLPVLYGSVMLNDGDTGEPLALFNGAKLTAVRTAAVGSAGIRYTASRQANVLGLIGTGVQGLHQIWFACKNHPIRQVVLFDAIECRLDPFIRQLAELIPEIQVTIAPNTKALTEQSDIIITATNSETPVLPDETELLRGKHVIAIGSYKENMVELPPAIFTLLDEVYVDVEFALEESGDLIHPIRNGWIRKDQVKLLSERFDIPDGYSGTRQTTVYKSVGMALFDLFTAQHYYHEALKQGLGQQVSW